jgi:hypothetical protein
VICGQSHLAHEVAREQDGLSVRCRLPDEPAHPQDAFRVEAVHRLVQDQGVRVAQERGGDAEALTHAE